MVKRFKGDDKTDSKKLGLSHRNNKQKGGEEYMTTCDRKGGIERKKGKKKIKTEGKARVQ